MNCLKKYVAILLVLALALFAVSCVNDGDETAASGTEGGSEVITVTGNGASDTANVESTEKETDDPSDPGMEDIFDDLKSNESDKSLL